LNGEEIVGEILNQRRQETAHRVEELQKELRGAEKICGAKACVYAIGSFGRGEASRHSDLDLFIAGQGTTKEPVIRGLDEILIKADLIEATRKLGIPDFSGDGEYVKHYTVEELITTLGTPEDDVQNTFTARLLLLLESSPLIGDAAYHQITDEVIAAYWKDYEQNKNDFMPAFLANDILRMWRTFCVNYEVRTKKEPEDLLAKRRLKNYTLKHSRLLTCYSALLYLLAIFTKNHTVGPGDVKDMISLTPTSRLEWLLTQSHCAKAHESIQNLISQYEAFLRKTDAPKNELVEIFKNKQKRNEQFGSQYQFGNAVSEVLGIIGEQSLFYRLLVV
jgi:predicted nucleotidyltransferase